MKPTSLGEWGQRDSTVNMVPTSLAVYPVQCLECYMIPYVMSGVTSEHFQVCHLPPKKTTYQRKSFICMDILTHRQLPIYFPQCSF